MGHSRDERYGTIANAIKAGAGANQNGPVAIFDHAGYEFGTDEFGAVLRVRFAEREIKDACVGADPNSSAAVGEDRADSVTEGFGAEEIVVEEMAVVTVDTVKPCSDPYLSLVVFGQGADMGGDWHGRRVRWKKLVIVEAKEALIPCA